MRIDSIPQQDQTKITQQNETNKSANLDNVVKQLNFNKETLTANPAKQPQRVSSVMQFKVKDGDVSADIVDRKTGNIIRTIPPTDLLELIQENNMNNTGTAIDYRA